MSLLSEEKFEITDDSILFESVTMYLRMFNKVNPDEKMDSMGYYREPTKNEEVYVFVSRPNTSKTRYILYVPKRYWDKKNYKGKYGYKTHGPYQMDYEFLNKNYTRVCRSKENSGLVPRGEWSWKYVNKSEKIGVTLNYIKEMSWMRDEKLVIG